MRDVNVMISLLECGGRDNVMVTMVAAVVVAMAEVVEGIMAVRAVPGPSEAL